MKKERIGLFGGTFNPIHLGHLKAAEIVQRRLLLDKILFIPSYIPPHKGSAEIASPFHRLKMVELALASCPQFITSSLEIEAKGESYSVITISKIKELYPNAWIFFILGIDSFLEIDTWKDYKKVLEQCFFIVISRPGYEFKEIKKILKEEYRERMVKLYESEEAEEEMLSSFKIFLLPIDALDVASTMIRKRIKKSHSIKELVSEAVEDYIRKHKLYQL